MRVYLLLFFLLILSTGSAPAQQISSTARDSVSFYDMSLEDLMKVEVTVATSKALTPRESPGIITFITEDEIRKSGATDLIELLQKVPGFDFGVDVEGVIGLGVRGNWAHEGKVLMLLDGHELNEDLFSAIVLGAHYSVSSIKQIEIIRGPGSAVYGGNAEYAVINIITKQAGSGNGIAVNTTYSQMSRQYATRNISLSAMKPLGDVQVNLSAFFNESNRSQNDFTDNYGSSYNMAENSGIHTAQGKLDLTWKKLKLSAFADQYHLLQRDGYENALSKTYPTDFNSYHILGEYEVHVNDKLSLLPTVKFKHQTPWNFEGTSLNDEFVPYSVSVESFLGQLKANYDINSSTNLITGLEGCKQIAAQRIDSTYFSNGSGKFEINNMAAFAQMLIRSKIANITFGARYNANDRFADAFVPRIGLTRVFNKWHVKLLYSSAFRSPSIENINSGNGIKPERTTVTELETGYEFGANTYLTANIFDITTHDPIIFYYTADNLDAYKNDGVTGSRGFELEYRVKTLLGYMNLNYSFFTTRGKKTNETYSIPGKKGKVVAFPNNKVTLSSNLKISRKVNLSPSITLLDTRYDYYVDANSGKDVIVKYDPAAYIDMMFNFEQIFTRGLTIQAGCINVLDSKVVYIQPYNNNHAALPGLSREYRLNLCYRFDFHK